MTIQTATPTTMSTTNPDDKKVTEDCTDPSIEERIDRLEDIVDDLTERVEDLEDDVDQNDNRVSALARGLSKAHDEIEIINAHTGLDDVDDADAAEDREPPQTTREQTGLEDVVSLPETVAEDALRPNEQRARFIARDIDEYSTSVMAGRRITSSELSRILRAGTECKGHTQTVERVMEFLDTLGEDEVEIRETKRGNKAVVFHESLIAGLRMAQSQRCDTDATAEP